MIVSFEKDYLRELYINGKTSDKKHRYQPQIIKKYTRIIDLMIALENVMGLLHYSGLRYERLQGDKAGLSSVRVNDQYRIEFREIIQDKEIIAKLVSITDLLNHYQ